MSRSDKPDKELKTKPSSSRSGLKMPSPSLVRHHRSSSTSKAKSKLAVKSVGSDSSSTELCPAQNGTAAATTDDSLYFEGSLESHSDSGLVDRNKSQETLGSEQLPLIQHNVVTTTTSTTVPNNNNHITTSPEKLSSLSQSHDATMKKSRHRRYSHNALAGKSDFVPSMSDSTGVILSAQSRHSEAQAPSLPTSTTSSAPTLSKGSNEQHPKQRQDQGQDKRQDHGQDKRQDHGQDKRQDQGQGQEKRDQGQDKKQDHGQDKRQDQGQDKKQDQGQEKRQDHEQDRRQDQGQQRQNSLQHQFLQFRPRQTPTPYPNWKQNHSTGLNFYHSSTGYDPPDSSSFVKLNIGGYKYVTLKSTLCQNPNFFSSLLGGAFPTMCDSEGYIFVNRPGKYFEPILEYLLTDDVVVPEGMSTKALCREAAFYGIDFPLVEDHLSLSFVTDDWLDERFENRAYLKIAPLADAILSIVLKQFKEKADKSLKIETYPFLLHDLSPVEKWLDEREFAREYWRFEFIDRQKKIYEQGCVANDDFFALLNVEENQQTIINYCKMHSLTVTIEPVRIHEPGMKGRHYFTIGYKFVHVREERKKKKRGSLHLEPSRITSNI